MTEAEFQRRITDYCDVLDLKWHHETDSRKTHAGFPDLVIVGQGVIFAELKSDRGRITPDQQKWIAALQLAGAEAYLWRPNDWPFVMNRLAVLAGRRLVGLG